MLCPCISQQYDVLSCIMLMCNCLKGICQQPHSHCCGICMWHASVYQIKHNITGNTINSNAYCHVDQIKSYLVCGSYGNIHNTIVILITFLF